MDSDPSWGTLVRLCLIFGLFIPGFYVAIYILMISRTLRRLQNDSGQLSTRVTTLMSRQNDLETRVTDGPPPAYSEISEM